MLKVEALIHDKGTIDRPETGIINNPVTKGVTIKVYEVGTGKTPV